MLIGLRRTSPYVPPRLGLARRHPAAQSLHCLGEMRGVAGDDKAAYGQPPHQHHRPARGYALHAAAGIMLADQAAQGHAAEGSYADEHGVDERTAELLETNVDAFGGRSAQRRAEVLGLIVDCRI